MFRGLKETIISLNNGAKTVANCEKAKKLKKKLLCIGLPLAIIGFAGAFACIILFATAGFSAVNSHTFGFSSKILIPFVLLIPCAIMGGIGASITSLGVRIAVTGYATKLIDEAVGNNCPKCGDEITSDEMFCAKCGEKVRLECKKCGQINSIKSKYCKKCGNNL